MILHANLKSTAVALLFIWAGCGDPQPNDGNNGGGDSLSVDTTSVSSVLKVNGKLFSVPSPVQSALLIRKLELPYDQALAMPLDKAQQVATRSGKALAMGVFGADLAYVTTYKDAQRAVSTLQAIEILGRSLNVGNAFDQPLLKRFKDNLNNEDSLLVLGSAAYRSADQYLKNNASDDISVLVLTGGFIESLYLSTASPGALKDQGIADRIGEQKTTLNNLVDLIGAIDGQQEVGTLLTGLKELQVMFAGITLTYEYAEPVTDAAAKTTYINSTRTVTITGEQLNAIATKVTELRNTMLA